MDLSLAGFQTPKPRTRLSSSQRFTGTLPVVMRAKKGSPGILDRKDGFVEIKWDGTRTILIKKQTSNHLFNGRGVQTNQTNKYQDIVQEANKLNCKTCILDAELVFFDSNGDQYFLTSSAKSTTIDERNLTYKLMVFDILEKDGKNLRRLPIEERKRILESVIPVSLDLIKKTKIVRSNKREFLAEQLEMGREGVMFKVNGSVYVEGESKSWLKVKRVDTIDVIAKGMTSSSKQDRIKYFGALKCYLPDGRGYRYIGKVGGGFTQQDLKDVLPYARSNRPFIIEVSIMEWTRDGQMRSPSFVRLRLDKRLDEVSI